MSITRSIMPVLFGRDWWDGWDFPFRLADQHFGLGLGADDFYSSPLRSWFLRPSVPPPPSTKGVSTVQNDPSKFQVTLDVSHFSPKELTVKTVDNYVVIHGKHEERADEHGFIQREFTRRYMLPQGVESEAVTSSLSSDGVLTVQAPKKALEEPPSNERVVPITMKESPAIATQNPSQKQEEK